MSVVFKTRRVARWVMCELRSILPDSRRLQRGLTWRIMGGEAKRAKPFGKGYEPRSIRSRINSVIQVTIKGSQDDNPL